jgi:hypothetical protein
MTIYASVHARETMWLFDGGLDSELPEDGEGQTVVAGQQAIFVGSRIDADAATSVTVADQGPGADAGLHLEYQGEIEVTEGVVRLSNVLGHEYWSMRTERPSVPVDIWVDYVEEPGVIWFKVDPQ